MVADIFRLLRFGLLFIRSCDFFCFRLLFNGFIGKRTVSG